MEPHDTLGEPTEEVAAPTPWLRVWTLGHFQIEWVDPLSKQITPLPAQRLHGQNAANALGLLKALLSCPDRFATRSWLLEQFWPESRHKSAEERLTDVVSSLRTLLRCEGNSEKRVHFVYGIGGRGAGFRLDGYPALWCDADAFEWSVKHALLLDQRGLDSSACWQRAFTLAERGSYLPEQIYEEWARQRRDHLEGLLRDCLQHWTQLLRQQGHVEEAILRLRSYWLEHLTDEDALRPLLELLGERERFAEAEHCFEKARAALAEDGLEPDPRTRETLEVVRALKVKRRLGIPHFLQRGKTHIGERESVSPGQWETGSTLFPFKHDGGELVMGYSRRNFLQNMVGMTGTALFPGTFSFDQETFERLSSALHQSALDEATLIQLEMATKIHRDEFVRSDGNMWQEIFQEMSGHLRVITQLLERHLQHPHLCTIAGETALLLGDLLFNAGENAAADTYYRGAFEACQGNALLQAVILGRRALIPIYDRFPQQALQLIEEAQQVAPPTAADLLIAWLWAVKAEAYASLGDAPACFQALSSAERLLDRGRSGEITLHFQPEIAYATFNLTKLAGYKGACLLHLKRSESAQEILADQLTLVEQRAQIHQQSIALVDLATSFAQQAAIRQASEYATNALTCLEQTRSIRVFQRILKLRYLLRPWESTVYVTHLDEHLHVCASDFMKGIR